MAVGGAVLVQRVRQRDRNLQSTFANSFFLRINELRHCTRGQRATGTRGAARDLLPAPILCLRARRARMVFSATPARRRGRAPRRYASPATPPSPSPPATILLVVAAATLRRPPRRVAVAVPPPQHLGKNYAGLWEFPGGKVEPGAAGAGAGARALRGDWRARARARAAAAHVRLHRFPNRHLVMPPSRRPGAARRAASRASSSRG